MPLTAVRVSLQPLCVWVRKPILTRYGVAWRRLQPGALTAVASGVPGVPGSVSDFPRELIHWRLPIRGDLKHPTTRVQLRAQLRSRRLAGSRTGCVTG